MMSSAPSYDYCGAVTHYDAIAATTTGSLRGTYTKRIISPTA